jgi:type I restriction enzyme S subunit
MKELRIKDICDKGSSNLKQKDVEDGNGLYPVYGASGIIGHINTYHQNNNYIAIVKDGSGIGRVTFMPAQSSVIGTMQYILPKNGFNINYIGYCLQSLDLSKYKQGAAIPHIYFKDYGERIVKVAEDMDEQQRVVDYLDALFAKIDRMKDNTSKALDEAKALFQSALSEVMTSKDRWEEKTLEDLGELKNGMNYTQNESGYSIHILGVGDFGDKYCIDNTSSLPIVALNETPNDKYLLKDEDIVFVRSNGNKQLVGRCVLVYPHNTPTSFSGFCIRFRKNNNDLDSEYLVYYLKKPETRKSLTGNGANISNLNQKVLKQLSIAYPSLPEQRAIVNHLDTIFEKVKTLEANYTKIVTECDTLKQSILKQIFE